MTDEIIELSGIEAHQQRLKELKLQKSLDKKWGIKQEPLKEALVEINVRYIRYQVFQEYSRDFLILQSVQDFNRLVTPLQKKKLNRDKPVAIDRSNQKLIYIINDEFQYKE